jgi:ribosomal subunit interface protein
MNIILRGTDLEVSDSLRRYVDDKLHGAFRAFGSMDLESVEVVIELERTTRHHRKGQAIFRAEANVTLPGRKIRVETTADDIHRAVIQLKHALAREVRTWRERLIDARRKGARAATRVSEEGTTEAPEPMEEAVDLEDPGTEPPEPEAGERAAWVQALRAEAEGEEDEVWEWWDEAGEDERDNV